MPLNIPISDAKVDQLIDCLRIESDHRILDAGCGNGEFLLRASERVPCHGLGLDQNASLIAAANTAATTRSSARDCRFEVADLQNHQLTDAPYDAAICLGSTHAFASGDSAYPTTLRELSRIVRPGGRILVGEAYRKQPPHPDYLQLIGDPVGIYRNHRENVALAETQGLIPLYAIVSNEDEWDHFEWSHRMAIEEASQAAPDDESLAAKLRPSHAWRDGYLQWGRTTMGFGFYLFQKPIRSDSFVSNDASV